MSVHEKTYLESEIKEQEKLIRELFQDRERISQIGVQGLNLGKVEHIQILACGTSYHAGLYGKRFLEKSSNLPVSITPAYEFLFSNLKLLNKTLFILISQSGETKDLIDCFDIIENNNSQVILMTNGPNSTLAARIQNYFNLNCGKEHSIAATKTFTLTCMYLYIFSLNLSVNRGFLKKTKFNEKTLNLEKFSNSLGNINKIFDILNGLSNDIISSSSTLFLGTGNDYPSALESALKVKEITYKNVDALSLGELKHGPMATLDRSNTCIIFISDKKYFSRYKEAIKMIEKTGAKLIVLSTVEISEEKSILIKNECRSLSPLLFVIFTQYLALNIGKKLNIKIDNPRNLSKIINF